MQSVVPARLSTLYAYSGVMPVQLALRSVTKRSWIAKCPHGAHGVPAHARVELRARVRACRNEHARPFGSCPAPSLVALAVIAHGVWGRSHAMRSLCNNLALVSMPLARLTVCSPRLQHGRRAQRRVVAAARHGRGASVALQQMAECAT